eukprot:scaffold1804_cov263-Pinguiococcus_pyrenoidosus.AAC.22
MDEALQRCEEEQAGYCPLRSHCVAAQTPAGLLGCSASGYRVVEIGVGTLPVRRAKKRSLDTLARSAAMKKGRGSSPGFLAAYPPLGSHFSSLSRPFCSSASGWKA